MSLFFPLKLPQATICTFNEFTVDLHDVFARIIRQLFYKKIMLGASQANPFLY
jgi:hypothetical protein